MLRIRPKSIDRRNQSTTPVAVFSAAGAFRAGRESVSSRNEVSKDTVQKAIQFLSDMDFVKAEEAVD